MKHIILTCKNHPDLRWSCKEIAVNPDGSYNGLRNIFYRGRLEGPAILYVDKSGIAGPFDRCHPECSCSPKDMTFAPENITYDPYV